MSAKFSFCAAALFQLPQDQTWGKILLLQIPMPNLRRYSPHISARRTGLANKNRDSSAILTMPHHSRNDAMVNQFWGTRKDRNYHCVGTFEARSTIMTSCITNCFSYLQQRRTTDLKPACPNRPLLGSHIRETRLNSSCGPQNWSSQHDCGRTL